MDTEVEQEVLGILGREYPQMGLLGEESSGVHAGEGYVWIVDPLDGTRNYASGIPFFSTVIGLALDGEVLVGVNYDPVREDLFEAERGRGAFLNGGRATVSERTELAECIIGTDLSYNNRGAANALEVIGEIWPGMQTARIMGSAALGLSYAATGRTDLYFHHQLEPWDQVAGMLLAEEAGGIVTDRTGRRAGLYSDGIVVSNRPCTPSSCAAPKAWPGASPRPRLRSLNGHASQQCRPEESPTRDLGWGRPGPCLRTVKPRHTYYRVRLGL